jgi:hypothetical protein
MKRYKHSVYKGQVSYTNTGELIRDGYGILEYENGRVYKGYWKDNLRHKRGIRGIVEG